MAAARIILTVALAAILGLACAHAGVVARSDYRDVERFPDRVGEIETLGVEVKSALPDGTVLGAE